MQVVKIALMLIVCATLCCCPANNEPAATPEPTPEQPSTMLGSLSQAAGVEAQSYGHSVQTAQMAYRAVNGRFACSLDELMTIERELGVNPQISLVFGDCNVEGYTFTVISRDGKQFVLSD
ncbi:MAG: hypothetical protein P9M14_14450 [Candidatus Alcyoniella australis]|nr:hypothetical protein [Candidatus Alcyoniella australis]